MNKPLTANEIIKALVDYTTACTMRYYVKSANGPTQTVCKKKNDAIKEIERLIAIRDDMDIPYEGKDQ